IDEPADPAPIVETFAPQPSMDVAPEASPGLESEASSDLEPEASWGIEPAASSGIESEAHADIEPEANEKIESQEIESGSSPEVAPSSGVAADAAVIDASGAWPSDDAVTAHVLAPADATCDRLRELSPACCIVNLAAPNAIEAAVALRAGDVTVPFFGCVVGDGQAIALGRIDVVTRPVDPVHVCTRLEALAARGANVVMVGSESGLLIPLRQGVQQAGMSVKTAWNRAQAMQLADAVQPDVVIMDVASETAETAALLCDLAQRAQAPRLVLVVGTPAHQDELRTALLARTQGSGGVD